MKWTPGGFLPPLPLILPAILSGVLVTLCFPIASLGPVSFLALAPIFVALLRVRPGWRDSFRAGFLMGATSYLLMMWWIVKLSPAADATIPVISKIIPHNLMMPLLLTPALILLTAYLALYIGVFAALTAVITRWRKAPFILAAPALWALLELGRSRGELAFPWGVLGYTLSYHVAFLQTADLWGVYGLSFLIVLVNASIAGLVVAPGPRARAACGLLACSVAAGILLYGNHAVTRADALQGPSYRVTVAQPNIDLSIKWKPEFKDSAFNQIDRQAKQGRDQGARLVIFPETCAPIYIENAPMYKSRLMGTAKWLGIPIFVGFLDHRYDGPNHSANIYNAAGLIMPYGSIQKYDKRHLLPFGESLPFSEYFRSLRRIDFGQANFEPGPDVPPLNTGEAKFTPLICFESVFADLCREGVDRGAQFFVNITNDGWFGDTPGPYQHAQMCIARAVEFRRYLLRSANSGVSMVVSPAGDIVARLGLGETGILTRNIRLLSGRTVYARTGDTPLALVSLVLGVLAWVVARLK